MSKAVVYWLKASQQALARSASIEAAAQLRKGLDALAGLPDDPKRRQQELDLPACAGPRADGDEGICGTRSRRDAGAGAHAGRADRPSAIPLAGLPGAIVVSSGEGEHAQALALAEQLEAIGKERNDVAAELVGRFANGRTRLFLGDLAGARQLLERCGGLADPAHRGGASSADPYAMMLAYLAWTLAISGHLDQAQARLNEALSEARQRKHAHTLADVLLSAGTIDGMIGAGEMPRYGEELMTLASEARAAAGTLAWAHVYRGASLAGSGHAPEGVPLIAQGLAGLRATGAVQASRALLMVSGGGPWPGRTAARRAERPSRSHRDHRQDRRALHEGELCIARAAICSMPAAIRLPPTASYRQAIAVAAEQGAKLFELPGSDRPCQPVERGRAGARKPMPSLRRSMAGSRKGSRRPT